MTIRTKSPLAAMVLMTTLWPTTSAAQPACGPDQTVLMYCTVEDGARTLNLCLSGDTINYAFGPTGGAPTLEMTRVYEDVAYAPSIHQSGAIHEHVTLFNGNYGYEMFTSSRLRTDPDAIAEGGIIVRLPDGQTQTLTCDAGTIIPNNPFDGIGQLARLAGEGQDDPLGFCLERLGPDTTAATCLRQHRDTDITRGACNPSTDTSGCWEAEAAAWEQILETRFEAALARLAALNSLIDTDTFRVAQDTWVISRNLDCEVYSPNPFAPDGGKAQCLAEYSANRVTFLEQLVRQAEFDG